jgi:hypothetical protein
MIGSVLKIVVVCLHFGRVLSTDPIGSVHRIASGLLIQYLYFATDRCAHGPDHVITRIRSTNLL